MEQHGFRSRNLFRTQSRQTLTRRYGVGSMAHMALKQTSWGTDPVFCGGASIGRAAQAGVTCLWPAPASRLGKRV